MTLEKIDSLIDSIIEHSPRRNEHKKPKKKQLGNFDQFILALPEKFINESFETFIPTSPVAEKAKMVLIEHSKQIESGGRPQNIVIMGPPGRGKDHLLISLGKVVSIHKKVLRITGFELFSKIRKSFTEGDSEIRQILSCDVLILSDLMQSQRTDWQLEVLSWIVDFRWARNLAIWLSTNFANRFAMEKNFGIAVTDRLFDKAIVIGAFWDAFRKPAIVIQ